MCLYVHVGGCGVICCCEWVDLFVGVWVWWCGMN